MKEKKYISVVVHENKKNENVRFFLEWIDKILSQHFENYEYIIVNNKESPFDLSSIKPFLEVEKRVIHVVNLSWGHSIEDAMRAGIDKSMGDFVFEFDSTNIDFPEHQILKIYFKALEGFDAVAAVPENKVSFKSRLFYVLLNRLSYKNMVLQTETFRIVSRRMLNRSSIAKEVFRYRKANYHYSGLKTAVLSYRKKNRGQDKSFSFGDQISLGSNILIYYSSIGIKISLMLSILFLGSSILIGGYAVWSYFFNQENIVEGWTTTILFISISFTGLFTILAVLSKYMEVLLKGIQVNQPYTIQSVERL